jgi:putative ABC transport system permease protein
LKEIREVSMDEKMRPVVYRLHDQSDQMGGLPNGIVIRTSVEPESIVPAVRQAIWSVDKNQAIWHVETLQQIMDRQLSTPAQSTTLLSAFAILALLLASIGLYGVLSYAVTQRTKEIGVRMALGATAAHILLSFGRRGLALTLAGLGVGLGLSIGATRLMTTLLYGFRPNYFPVIAAVIGVLLFVAVIAVLIPARRASRIDPMVALQHE